MTWCGAAQQVPPGFSVLGSTPKLDKKITDGFQNASIGALEGALRRAAQALQDVHTNAGYVGVNDEAVVAQAKANRRSSWTWQQAHPTLHPHAFPFLRVYSEGGAMFIAAMKAHSAATTKAAPMPRTRGSQLRRPSSRAVDVMPPIYG